MSDELRMPLPLTAEEAFRCASFGVEHVPVHVPVRFDRDCPRTMVFFEHRDRPIVFNSALWGGYADRDADDVVEQPLTDELLAWIRDNPKTFAPANRYWRKPEGTVRRWFRQMRAADVERAFELKTASLRGAFFIVQPNLIGWTVLDTMNVVDRELTALYLPAGTPKYDYARLLSEGRMSEAHEMRLRGDPEYLRRMLAIGDSKARRVAGDTR